MSPLSRPSTTFRPPPLAERLDAVDIESTLPAHIVADPAACRDCRLAPCVVVCPAGLFVRTSEGRTLFNHEGCLECGACAVVCPDPAALRWSYPPGGAGCAFHRG